MFASLLRWLRGRVHRPVGLGLAAVVPTLLFVLLFRHEIFSAHPWEHLLRRGEMTTGNFLRRHGRPAALRPDLVFLGVDDASMKLDMLWPEEIEASRALQLISQSKGFADWPREIHALVLDRLVSAGAKLVIFDMVFPNPFQGDDAFRAALDKHRGQVVVGAKFIQTQIVIGNRTVSAFHDDAWQGPTPALFADPVNDPRVGYVNYKQDLDGAIRTVLFHTTQSYYNGRAPRTGEPTYDSEMARALRQLGRGDLIPAEQEPQLFRYTDLAHDVDYPAHPLWEIFSDALWRQNYGDGAFFKDKVVVVGAAAAILHDVQPTPFGDIPGPDLQLQALGAALSRDYLTLTNIRTDLALILAAGILAWGLGVAVRQPLVRLGAFAAASAAFSGESWSARIQRCVNSSATANATPSSCAASAVP